MNAVVKLTPDEFDGAKREAFAQLVARLGNFSVAYRQVFNPPSHYSPMTVWRTASALANQPDMASRIRQLAREHCDGVLMTVRELVNDWADIATADPNEIVQHVVRCCRHCHGVDFAYQWRDMQEWVDDCTKRAEEIVPRQPASMSGGFGYNPHRDPHEACPHCYGRGVGETIVHDTTKLTGKARKLYKGMRQKANGEIEVLLHDQEAARQALGRAMGLLGGEPPQLDPKRHDAKVIDAATSPVDAANAYLQMVK